MGEVPHVIIVGVGFDGGFRFHGVAVVGAKRGGPENGVVSIDQGGSV